MKAKNLKSVSEAYLNNLKEFKKLPKNTPVEVRKAYLSELNWLEKQLKKGVNYGRNSKRFSKWSLLLVVF